MNSYTTRTLDYKVSGYGDFEALKAEILEEMPTRKMMWADKINQIVRDSGFTVAQFAKLCNVSVGMVRNWRNGVIPQNRDTFIRIGFAVGYDLEQMNDFLTRYGYCHDLYSKDLDDTACIFVLQSKNLPHTYENCEILRQHLECAKNDFAAYQYPVYSTEKMDADISLVSTEDDLLRYVRENAASYAEAHEKFYSYVEFYLDANRAYEEEDEKHSLVTRYMPIQELAQEQNWSSSLRKCISQIKGGYWPLRRNKILSLGLHLNMSRIMFDQMLSCAHMRGLYARNPAEAILIFALEEYQMDVPDERIIQDGSSELRDRVRDYLIQAGQEDATFLQREL
jgi:DNA-binding transcriptional regulator YiaG